MSAVFEDINQVEPAPEYAGLFSWFKRMKFRPKQPKADTPKAGSPEAGAYERQEPSFDRDEGGSAKGPAVSEELKTDLLSSIARIWQQATVDAKAFERIKNFKTEVSPFQGTMALVNDEDDIIYFGINPKDGSHAVMSPPNISARHALEQVYVALTDDLMRAEGIDDVDGTDLDKALLCLAAEKNGLKINNMPVLSDEVKAEARKLWQEAFPEDAPAAAAPAAEPAAAAQSADTVIHVDNADILPAVAAATEMGAAIKAAHGEIIDAEFTEVKPAAPVAALEAPSPVLALEDAQTPVAEAPPAVIILGYTPDTPAQEAPAPDATADVVAQAPVIKPAALDILRGDTAENSVAPETFQSFVADLKDGKYSDDLGMLSEDAIRATFTRPVGDATEADVMLKAAAVQGVVYPTTKTVPALRMLVNPHVQSPVLYNPNKKAPVAEAPQETVSASGKILEQAHIRAETYEAVKSFVAQREGDIISPVDLVHEFAAKAGVGTTKAHALMAALEADAITQVEDNVHRVVRTVSTAAQGQAQTQDQAARPVQRQPQSRGQHL